MSSIDKLVPTADQLIYDQEEHTRQLLFLKLSKWIRSSYATTSELNALRSMALQLQGLNDPPSAIVELLEARGSSSEWAKDHFRDRPKMSDVLAASHCVEFVDMGEVNRRQVIAEMLAYVGITNANELDILGESRAMKLKFLIEFCVTGQKETATQVNSALDFELDNWGKSAIESQLMALLSGTGYFDITAFDRILRAVNSAIEQAGGVPVREEKIREYAGLQALHCVDYTKMSDAVFVGLPAAILDGLGLSSGCGVALLGAEGWSKITAEYSRVSSSRVAVGHKQLPGPQVTSWWQKIWSRIAKLLPVRKLS